MTSIICKGPGGLRGGAPTGTLGLAVVSQVRGWAACGQGVLAPGSPPLGARGQTMSLWRTLSALQPQCHSAWAPGHCPCRARPRPRAWLLRRVQWLKGVSMTHVHTRQDGRQAQRGDPSESFPPSAPNRDWESRGCSAASQQPPLLLAGFSVFLAPTINLDTDSQSLQPIAAWPNVVQWLSIDL